MILVYFLSEAILTIPNIAICNSPAKGWQKAIKMWVKRVQK